MSTLMCCPLMPTVHSEPLSVFGGGTMLFFMLVCVNPVMLLGWSESGPFGHAIPDNLGRQVNNVNLDGLSARLLVDLTLRNPQPSPCLIPSYRCVRTCAMRRTTL